eukprot:1778210-Rhodomonas_salina.1
MAGHEEFEGMAGHSQRGEGGQYYSGSDQEQELLRMMQGMAMNEAIVQVVPLPRHPSSTFPPNGLYYFECVPFLLRREREFREGEVGRWEDQGDNRGAASRDGGQNDKRAGACGVAKLHLRRQPDACDWSRKPSTPGQVAADCSER